MSAIEQHINTIIEAIKHEQIIASRTVTVERHGGRFTWDELAKKTHMVPVIFISVLGFSALRGDELDRYTFIAGSKKYRVRITAGIVTRSNKALEDRNAEGQYIAEQLTDLLHDNDFEQSTLSVPENIVADGLFVPQAEKNAMSLWTLKWECIVGTGSGLSATDYDNFLLATGQHRNQHDAVLAESRTVLTGFHENGEGSPDDNEQED